MYRRLVSILIAACCLPAGQAFAAETVTQRSMSMVCGATAAQQQLAVMKQLPAGTAGSDGLAHYRETLRGTSSGVRDAMQGMRTADSAFRALDDHFFEDAVNLGIVLQSEPALAAEATRQVIQGISAAGQAGTGQLAVLQEAWIGLCLQQLQGQSTLARRRELTLCNTFAVIGIMQRQRFDWQQRTSATPESVEAMMKKEREATSMMADSLALNWVDDAMKAAAIRRGAVIAAEVPLAEVDGFRELAQRLAKDPLRLPYGDRCEAFASGAMQAPVPQPDAAPVEVRTKYQLTFRPDLSDFYPAESKRLREQGMVKLKVCFDARGSVTEVTILESSGFKNLDKAALKAGKQFRFRPGTLDFVPQPECALVPIKFSYQ